MTHITVRDHCGNENDTITLFFTRFTQLKEIVIGDECFMNVDQLNLIGLSRLQKVVIGMNSFTKKKKTWPKEVNADRQFFLKGCPAMKKLRVDDYSFSDYSVCEMEQLPSLEDIEMGDLVPEHSCFCFYFASLELKSGNSKRE